MCDQGLICVHTVVLKTSYFPKVPGTLGWGWGRGVHTRKVMIGSIMVFSTTAAAGCLFFQLEFELC